MSLSQHIPGAKDGGVKPVLPDHALALGAYRNVFLHIDEMLEAEFRASLDCFTAGYEINGAKLRHFRRRWMRHSDQLDESIGGTNQLAVGIGFQRIAGYHLALGGQLGFRAGADQGAHAMATLEEQGDQAAADITCPSCNEYAPRVGRLGQRLHLQQKPDVGNGSRHEVVTLLEAEFDCSAN